MFVRVSVIVEEGVGTESQGMEKLGAQRANSAFVYVRTFGLVHGHQSGPRRPGRRERKERGEVRGVLYEGSVSFLKKAWSKEAGNQNPFRLAVDVGEHDQDGEGAALRINRNQLSLTHLVNKSGMSCVKGIAQDRAGSQETENLTRW